MRTEGVTPVVKGEECCLTADKLYIGFQKMSKEVIWRDRQVRRKSVRVNSLFPLKQPPVIFYLISHRK